MDLLDRILTPSAAAKREVGHPESADTYNKLFGTSNSAAGIPVDEYAALNQSTFFACVSILAEDTAVLPWYVWEWVDEKNKRAAEEHPAYSLLLRRPNAYSTAFTFVETLVGYLKTWRNSFAYIERNERGDAIGLHPLLPSRVTYKFVTEDSDELIYRVDTNSGGAYIPAANMFHVPGHSIDGVGGMRLAESGADPIGIAIEADRYAAEMFKNGTVMGGFIEVPDVVWNDPPKRKDFLKTLEDRHAGSGNRHKIGALPTGAKWQGAGVEPKNSQILESRVYQKREMCALMKVPPYRVGDLADATFSNVEHQQIDYRTTAILPICKKLASEANIKLIRKEDQGRYFTEFLHEAYLQADQKSQNEALWLQRQAGVINANDWLGLTNRNQIAGKAGRIYWMPVNMQDAENPGPVKDLNADSKSRSESADDRNKVALECTDRTNATKSAMFPLVLSAVSKVLKFEQSKVGKMLKTKGGESKAVKWYGEHQAAVRQSVDQVVDAYFAAMRASAGRDYTRLDEEAACTTTAHFAERHCMEMAKSKFTERMYDDDAALMIAGALVGMMDKALGSNP